MCYAGGPRCDDKNLSVEDLRTLNEKRLDKATKKIETFKGTPKEDTLIGQLEPEPKQPFTGKPKKELWKNLTTR